MKYVFAESVDDAVTLLAKEKGKARIMAGGTDLMVERQDGKHQDVEMFIDICRIPELKEIKVEGDYLIIGAAVCLTEIANSNDVLTHAPALTHGAHSVGCLQIGNMGTLVGNILTAQPAADAAMALGPMDASLVIVDDSGSRELPVLESYEWFAKSYIDSTKELVTHVKIPVQKEGQFSSFQRLEQRSALALPMLNQAAMAEIKDGKFAWVRITMGPVGVGLTRAVKAEEWFAGKEVTLENIKEGSKLAVEDAKPRTNPLRGSKEYRLETLSVLVERSLREIAKQLNVTV